MTPQTPSRPTVRRRAARWAAPLLALVCLGALAGGCLDAMGPQPIPTPATHVDPEQLRFALDGQACIDGVMVSGEAGAIAPPGALVEIVNLSNLDRAVVRSDADGSFRAQCVAGDVGDVFRVTAIDDRPTRAGDEAAVDSVDMETQPGGGSGAADAGPTDRDAGGGAPPTIRAVPVPDAPLACVSVRPSRVVLAEPSGAPAPVVSAEVVAADDEERLEVAPAALSNTADEAGFAILNECRYDVRLLKATLRPEEGLAVRGAGPGVIAARSRRQVLVARADDAARANTDDAASADAAPSANGDTEDAAPTPVAADEADPGVWLIELVLAPADAGEAVDASGRQVDVRKVLVVSCDDPTAAADAASCASPPPAADAFGGSDAGARVDAAVREDVRPPADGGPIAAMDATVARDVPAGTRPDVTVVPGEDVPSGTAPDVAVAVGACLSNSDRDVLRRTDAHGHALRCATGTCLDQGRDCIIRCLTGPSTVDAATSPVLSDGCAGCLADEALCLRDECPALCTTTADDATCTACRDEVCTPRFQECAGLPASPTVAVSEAAEP